MKRLLASAACAGLGLAATSVANAAIIGSFVSQGTPVGGTTTLTGYTGYLLHITSDQGNIFGVDMSGTHQASGALHQRWTDPDNASAYVANPQGAANGSGTSSGNLDTHLLNLASTNFASAPAEDNPGTGSPLATTSSAKPGIGTFLSAAFASTIPGTGYGTSLDVAYFVIPDNQKATFTINQLLVNIEGQTFVATFFPEPATVSLAGLGMLGLLARRRRR